MLLGSAALALCGGRPEAETITADAVHAYAAPPADVVRYGAGPCDAAEERPCREARDRVSGGGDMMAIGAGVLVGGVLGFAALAIPTGIASENWGTVCRRDWISFGSCTPARAIVGYDTPLLVVSIASAAAGLVSAIVGVLLIRDGFRAREYAPFDAFFRRVSLGPTDGGLALSASFAFW